MANEKQNSPVAAPTSGAAAQPAVVTVISLAKPDGAKYGKQYNDTQKDSMGTQQRQTYLLLGDERIDVMKDGKIAKTPAGVFTVAPHVNFYLRLIVASWFSGATQKGTEYTLGVVKNAKIMEPTVKKLIEKNAVLVCQFGDSNRMLAATFKSVYEHVIGKAAIILETRKRFPESEEEAKPTTAEGDPTVQVAFEL